MSDEKAKRLREFRLKSWLSASCMLTIVQFLRWWASGTEHTQESIYAVDQARQLDIQDPDRLRMDGGLRDQVHVVSGGLSSHFNPSLAGPKAECWCTSTAVVAKRDIISRRSPDS